MLGFGLGLYWKFSWAIFVPLSLTIIFIYFMSAQFQHPQTGDGQVFPQEYLGKMMNKASVRRTWFDFKKKQKKKNISIRQPVAGFWLPSHCSSFLRGLDTQSTNQPDCHGQRWVPYRFKYNYSRFKEDFKRILKGNHVRIFTILTRYSNSWFAQTAFQKKFRTQWRMGSGRCQWSHGLDGGQRCTRRVLLDSEVPAQILNMRRPQHAMEKIQKYVAISKTRHKQHILTCTM